MATEERKLLESWKEIAAYLKRSEKTCRRFEETLGLPIHRLDGTPKARVFAYADELDAWLKGKLHHAEEEAAAEAARAAAEEDRAEARVRKRKRIGLLIGAASLAVLAAAAALLWSRISPAPGPILPRNPSLAVLPFDNPAKDPGLEPWRTAFADLVITDLVQSRYVNVVRITDLERKLAELKMREVASFKDDALKTFAEKAVVDYVATGSLVRRNGYILVSVQIRDPRKGKAAQPVQVGYRQEPEVFVAADRISKRIKIAVGLTSRHVSRDIDRDVADISTASPLAFRLFSQGYRLAGLANYTESVQLLQRAVEFDPKFGLAYRYLYRAYQNLTRSDDAEAYLRRARDLGGRLSEREKDEQELEYSRWYANDPAAERAALERLNRVYPQDRFPCRDLLVLYLGLEEWDKALAVAEAGWPANRSVPDICQELAMCYLNTGWGEKAAAVLSEFIEANPGPRAAFLKRSRAWCYVQMNKIDDALAEAERWLAQDPNEPEGLLQAGAIHLFNKDFPAARRLFEQVLEQGDPWYQLEALLFIRDMLLMEGRIDEAKKALQRGLDIAKGAGDGQARRLRPKVAVIHQELSYLHNLCGGFEEALKEIEEALSAAGDPSPSQPPIGLLGQKAVILLEMGRMEEFAKLAEEIKEGIERGSKPRLMRVYHYLLGRQALEKGDPGKAVGHLWRAVDLVSVPGGFHGADPEYFYDLAEAMRLSGSGFPDPMYEKITLPALDRIRKGDLYAMSLYRLGRSIERRVGPTLNVSTSRAQLPRAAAYYRQFLALWGGADTLFAPQVEDARTRLAAIEKQLASQ